jgi:hypothetical protein
MSQASAPLPRHSLESVALDESSVYAKVAWRLIPFLFLCYVAAYLDRVNVGFANLGRVFFSLAISSSKFLATSFFIRSARAYG